MSKRIPIGTLLILYAAVALFFADRLYYLATCIVGLILFLASEETGRKISEKLDPQLNNSYYMPLGLGIVLLACYPLFLWKVSLIVVAPVWLILSPLSIKQRKLLTFSLPIRYLWALPFLLLGIWSCFTPSTFFDALVYHLGLPHQYLARGQMLVLHYNLYSSFPPFGAVLQLLFSGIHLDLGIKVFNLLLLFQIIRVLCSFLKASIPNFSSEFLAIPVLFFPAAWILIHLITTELLLGLFFCSGVCYLASANLPLSRGNLTLCALLLTFSAWTKPNILAFIPLLIVLWLVQHRWKGLKFLTVIFSLFLLFFSPILIRNAVILKDPLYPVLYPWFQSPEWSDIQARTLRLDSFPKNVQTLADFFLLPVRLMFRPTTFGSAASIGIVMLFVFLIYPFVPRNRSVNGILWYFLTCYLVWAIGFPIFRRLFPAFLLLFLAAGVSFQFLAKKSKGLLNACWIVTALFSFLQMANVFLHFFPLIQPAQTQQAYLRTHLDYYPVAEMMNRTEGQILLLGDTRIAYYHKPLLFNSAYDQNILLTMARRKTSAMELREELRRWDVRIVVHNTAEMQRISQKNKTWIPGPREREVIDELARTYFKPIARRGPFFVFELTK